jgi:sulfonate transport system permease protein
MAGASRERGPTKGGATPRSLELPFGTRDHALNVYVRFENVPTPLRVAEAFVTHLCESSFYLHIAASLKRIAVSYALATGVGVLLGVAMGRSNIIRDIASPYIEILRPIPTVAWSAILIWPIASIIYITFLGALFPIILSRMHGVEQTPEILVRAAQSLGASRLQIFSHVALPAALPSICAGLAIGMGVSWFPLLADEIISGEYGIGYFTWNAYSVIHYPDIVVGMLSIGLFGNAHDLPRQLADPPSPRLAGKRASLSLLSRLRHELHGQERLGCCWWPDSF